MNPKEQQLNLELIELIEQIKKFPAKSSEYRKALNELFKTIFESKNLNKLFKYRYLNDFDNLYAEAKLRTYKYISQNINEYDSSKSKVMAWVNQTLYYKFLDVKNEQSRKKIEQVSLDNLDNILPAPPDENEQDSRSYLRVVIEDPEELLASIKLTYTNQTTNVEESISLKEILLMISKGNKRINIHQEYHIPRQSLYSFIERNLSPVKEKDSKKQKLKKQRIRDYFAKYSRS